MRVYSRNTYIDTRIVALGCLEDGLLAQTWYIHTRIHSDC